MIKNYWNHLLSSCRI